MLRRVAVAAFVSLAMVSCSGTRPERTGLSGSLEGLAKSDFPCNRSDEMQEYMRALWTSIQSHWAVSPKQRADQSVVLAIEFDGRGESRTPEIVESTDSDLKASVETAYRAAELPEPSEALRACLAGQVIKARFRVQPQG